MSGTDRENGTRLYHFHVMLDMKQKTVPAAEHHAIFGNVEY